MGILLVWHLTEDMQNQVLRLSASVHTPCFIACMIAPCTLSVENLARHRYCTVGTTLLQIKLFLITIIVRSSLSPADGPLRLSLVDT